MSRTSHRITLAVTAGLLGVALTACGSSEEAAAPSSSPAAQTGTAATTTSESSPTTSASVVGGPKPVAPTTSVADHHAERKNCGRIAGPDGALRILLLAGDIDCGDAKQVADQYAPKIATGERQTVGEWTCAPSEVDGLLAACQKGTSVVGFAP